MKNSSGYLATKHFTQFKDTKIIQASRKYGLLRDSVL